MDLAKIRKKSLQAQTEAQQGSFRSGNQAPVSVMAAAEPVIEPSLPHEVDFFQNVFPPAVVRPPGVPIFDVAERSDSMSTACNPLEIILAGRSAAGCDEDMALADDDFSQAVTDDYLEFLCFRVSDEIYGINIMDIKEIIKPREVTEVPRAPAFVTGILSLRGTIIPIIDMRLRLGLVSGIVTGKERVVVIKNNESFSGLLVDEVIQVVRVRSEAVEPAPAVLEGIDRDFVFGIGRSDGRLIIILNLASIADIHLY